MINGLKCGCGLWLWFVVVVVISTVMMNDDDDDDCGRRSCLGGLTSTLRHRRRVNRMYTISPTHQQEGRDLDFDNEMRCVTEANTGDTRPIKISHPYRGSRNNMPCSWLRLVIPRIKRLVPHIP